MFTYCINCIIIPTLLCYFPISFSKIEVWICYYNNVDIFKLFYAYAEDEERLLTVNHKKPAHLHMVI